MPIPAYIENLDTKKKVSVQFNPAELSLNKTAQLAEIAIPGLDAPVLQFIRGGTETMTLDLFFDTTQDGSSVTRYAQSLRGRMAIESSPSPNVCSIELRVRSPFSVMRGRTADSNWSRCADASSICSRVRSTVLLTSIARRSASSNVNRVCAFAVIARTAMRTAGITRFK